MGIPTNSNPDDVTSVYKDFLKTILTPELVVLLKNMKEVGESPSVMQAVVDEIKTRRPS